MPTYRWQTDAELREIDQILLPRLTQDSPIFKLFPVRETNQARVVWEQRDDYLGLMQGRGYNGFPPIVPQLGSKRFSMSPSVFGEFDLIDEEEITTRAPLGSYGNMPISVEDLVAERQEKLMSRQVNRMEWIMWTLLTQGVYTVMDVKGAIIGQDSYVPQSYTSAVTWATSATATPLADFRAVQLLHRGASVNFNNLSSAFMNRKTWNSFISNTNQADIAGKRLNGLATVQSLGDANTVLTADGLPNIVVYDEGYKDDTGAFVPWIGDNKVIVVGRRSNGASIGEFLLTRNANNPDNASRPYYKVVDIGARPDQPPPRRIEVHRGFNGGPAMTYPGSIVVMNV